MVAEAEWPCRSVTVMGRERFPVAVVVTVAV